MLVIWWCLSVYLPLISIILCHRMALLQRQMKLLVYSCYRLKEAILTESSSITMKFFKVGKSYACGGVKSCGRQLFLIHVCVCVSTVLKPCEIKMDGAVAFGLVPCWCCCCVKYLKEKGNNKKNLRLSGDTVRSRFVHPPIHVFIHSFIHFAQISAP